MFFYGQNDARAGWCDPATYPAEQFARDVTTIVDRLTSAGVRVIYNSIHYATPFDCRPNGYWSGALLERQQRYLSVWDSLMTTLVPGNPRLTRGTDLFALFRSDTVRFHFPDGAHANLSEATAAIVEALAPTLATVVNQVASGVKDERAATTSELTLVRGADKIEARIRVCARDRGEISLDAYNVVGEHVVRLFNGVVGEGEYVLPLETSKLVVGPYMIVMRTGATNVVKRFDVVR
jgi:hypothetical protein